MTFGSLFAGIGGLDLGLERSGMECRWQVEIDEYARRILERHWPNVRRWDNVTTFLADSEHDGSHEAAKYAGAEKSEKEVRMQQPKRHDNGWDVDLICGGFPCQDISFAGKGGGLDGKRSGLFYELMRIVRILRPRYVLLENVSALLVRGIDRVLGSLASCGYDAEWTSLSAAAVGAPHIRERIFILAYAQYERIRVGGPNEQAGGECRIGSGSNRNGGRSQESDQQTPGDANCEELQERTCFGSDARQKLAAAFRANRVDGNGIWHAEPDVVRVANGVPNRMDRIKGLGNSVVPQVGEVLGRCILEFEKWKSQNDS